MRLEPSPPSLINFPLRITPLINEHLLSNANSDKKYGLKYIRIKTSL